LGAYDCRRARAAATTDDQHTRATTATAGRVYMTADYERLGAYDCRRARAVVIVVMLRAVVTVATTAGPSAIDSRRVTVSLLL
jgi:hypothetical protein